MWPGERLKLLLLSAVSQHATHVGSGVIKVTTASTAKVGHLSIGDVPEVAKVSAGYVAVALRMARSSTCGVQSRDPYNSTYASAKIK